MGTWKYNMFIVCMTQISVNAAVALIVMVFGAFGVLSTAI